MTDAERFNNLKERLHILKLKNAISENRYLAVETILQQAKNFVGMENPPGLQLDLLVVQNLDIAEKMIKSAEDKGS
ncbi:MAG: hypothetical protein HFJ52_02890 [Clostridia bacterium]|nr:hypothetical protein [Clostridia bacterium]